jgi:hypothetical protein
VEGFGVGSWIITGKRNEPGMVIDQDAQVGLQRVAFEGESGAR